MRIALVATPYGTRAGKYMSQVDGINEGAPYISLCIARKAS